MMVLVDIPSHQHPSKNKYIYWVDYMFKEISSEEKHLQ